MEFCRYYGISVPQLILLNRLSDVPELSGYLNNPLEFEKIQDFKREIEFFVDFFQQAYPRKPLFKSRIKDPVEYTRWTLYENHMNSSKNKKPEDRLNKEELSIVKDVLRYKNISAFSEVNCKRKGGAVKLTEDEVAICSYFRSSLSLIPNLLDKIELADNRGSVVLGMNVMKIVQGNAEELLRRLCAKFRKLTPESNSYIIDFDEGVAKLETLISETSAKSVKSNHIKDGQDFGLTMEQERIMRLAREKNEDLKKNARGFQKLSETYSYLLKIDVDFYNQMFGLDKTQEEYEEIFEHLADIGLVGLNFSAPEFFLDFINTMSFSSEDKVVISPDSDCAYNIELARRFVDTLKLREGDPIE